VSRLFDNEARLYTRIDHKIPVAIFYNGQLIGQRFSSNIGVGGILINTDDLGLPVNALVEIELIVPDDFMQSRIRIPGVVNRVGKADIAIEFERLDKAAEAIIKNALNQQ